MGRADARRALKLRREGLSYLQIAGRLGFSESYAWRLVQRALADRADPRAVRAALDQCEELLMRLSAGATLDTVLMLQARLRAMCSAALPEQGKGLPGPPAGPVLK